jgi:hypothetical protein
LRSDPNWLLRMTGSLPLLPTPLPSRLQLIMRGDSSVTVIARHECPSEQDCARRYPVTLRWVLTADGWKAIVLFAGGDPRR